MAGRILGHPNPAMYQGAVASLAQLYVYAAGTTTLVSIYSDEGMTAPLANPLTADAYGLLNEVWAVSTAQYHVVLKTAGGTSIYDEDDISPQGGAEFPAPQELDQATTLSEADLDKRFSMTGTWALTLPAGSGLEPGWRFRGTTQDDGDVTLTAVGGENVDNATTKRIGPNNVFDCWWTGTQYETDMISAGLGRHALWIPVDAMIGRLTNGPGATVTEATTNKQTLRTLDFDASTVEYAQFKMRMPKGWNEGTFTFAPTWSHGSTTTNFKVSLGMRAVAFSNDDASDAAFGTAQYSNDTGGTTDDIYVGPESAAITIAGTPVAEDLVIFEVLRQADDATNDTLAVDARLLGVTLYLTIDAGNDA